MSWPRIPRPSVPGLANAWTASSRLPGVCFRRRNPRRFPSNPMMPPENNRNMEEWLKACADQRRREQGAPFELHPATREMLLA